MPSRWRVVYPSAFAQAWDCPDKCNLPGLHWYTAGGGRVVWRVGCGAGCAFVPRIYAHACHPPPGPAGLRGVCRVRGVCVVWCAVCRGCVVCPCIHAHGCHPPPAVVALWRGVRCAVWAVVGCAVGCPRIYAHGCHPPPGKGHKKSGAARVAAPPLWGCVYFWFLFMPPRFRMVASVSAISSGVYPAAAKIAPSLSSSTAFFSTQK